MSFADPQIITVNAIAKSMPRILQAGTSATYQTNDESFKLMISHQKTGAAKIRSMARVDQRIVAADPLTSVNDWQILSNYLVIERPFTGFSVTQVQQQITGFKTWCTDAIIAQLFGQES